MKTFTLIIMAISMSSGGAANGVSVERVSGFETYTDCYKAAERVMRTKLSARPEARDTDFKADAFCVQTVEQ